MSRIKLSFVQSMLGSGFPSTVQLKIAVSLSIFTVLTGCLVNPGASGRKKYKTTNQDRISKRNVQSYCLVKKVSVCGFSRWRKLYRQLGQVPQFSCRVLIFINFLLLLQFHLGDKIQPDLYEIIHQFFHRSSLANDSKDSRDYVNRLIGVNLSKYFSNDPPNNYWIPQS